jgi:hypothetical protein
MAHRPAFFALGALALAALAATVHCGQDCSKVECPSPPGVSNVVTFPCGRPAPATLTTSGSCKLAETYEGAPTVAFTEDGDCLVSATFPDGTTAQAKVSRTTVQSCCGGNYAYSGLVDGIPREVQLGGAACADGGFGSGYEGYDDAGSAAANDGATE